MTGDALYPPSPPTRPLWLVTLADLALLLVGFFVLIQASEKPRAITDALRESFGGTRAAAALPVMAAGLFDFAPGAAALPASPATVIAWAREAVRDPRVALTVTGSTDGSVADVDRATGSAALLAADRARALAAALAPVSDRITVTTNPRPGRRAAIVTLAFVGERSNPMDHQP